MESGPTPPIPRIFGHGVNVFEKRHVLPELKLLIAIRKWLLGSFRAYCHRHQAIGQFQLCPRDIICLSALVFVPRDRGPVRISDRPSPRLPPLSLLRTDDSFA